MRQLIAKPTGKFNILRVQSIFIHTKIQNIKIIECAQLKTKYEIRYIIINKYTNEIIDTADGWGYKSEQAAWNGYRCKLNHNVTKIDYSVPVPKSVKSKRKS